MAVSSIPAKLGAIAAIGAGTATASALVVLAAGTSPDTAVDRRPALGAAGAGVLLLAGGTVAARAAEQSLRPGLALAGRTSAALGAALLGGAIVGTVGLQLLRMLDGRGRVDQASKDLGAQQARAAEQPNADAATKDLAATRGLRDDYAPAPDGTAPRLPAGDPRVDIGGATVASAADALQRAYDTNDTGVVWVGEQQRVRDGRTLSIGSLVEHAPIKDGAPQFGNASELEAVVSKHGDRSGAGTRGVLDADEAASWYAPGGIGEKDITWDGEVRTTKGLFERTAVRAEDANWSLGPYADATGPILYLTNVHDERAARDQLRTMVHDDLPAPVLVRLPDGAPSEFGVVSLLRDGGRSSDRPDQGSMPQIRDGLKVVAVANKQGIF